MQDGDVRITAYGSTDRGISFLIESEGKTFFHAGDLNDWHWREDPETTAEKSARYTEKYRLELARLSQDVPHLDLAMFPLDPRLGNDFGDGAQALVDAIETDVFAPMHFWEEYELLDVFAQRYRIPNRTRMIRWTHRGQKELF